MRDNQVIEQISEAQNEWEETTLKKELEERGEWKEAFRTDSGAVLNRLYTPLDMRPNWNYVNDVGFPGQYPFVRGKTATEYRGEPGLIFTYAGFGTAESTNRRFKFLMEQGGTLSIALDLPTQIGLDSDHPLAEGEVGRQGVAVDSLADMEAIFDGIDLEKARVGGVFACIGPFQLALMLALAEKRNISVDKLHLHLNNDSIQEYTFRGTYIFPPRAGLKFSCDLIEWVIKNKLTDNIRPIQFSGYCLREAGGNVYQELGFVLAMARAYIEEIMQRGIDINDFHSNAVNFTAGFDLFEEVCKFRAFRRMFARMMKEEFHATNPQAMSVFFRAGCNSSRFTAQQPLNNIVRGTISALVQQLAGVQYAGIAAYDEALSIPTEESAKIAVRTHQIVAYESGVTNTVDPLAGSYCVESLTDEIEAKANEFREKIEEIGGIIDAIEHGYIVEETAQAAYQYQKDIESGKKVWVGVNKFMEPESVKLRLMKVDPKEEEIQVKKLLNLKKERDNNQVRVTLKALEEAAQEGENLIPYLVNAVKTYATIGEVFGVLRKVFGEYREARL
jgi:methylmalonyl-CoA mutase N-terminal domain/subunit